MAERAARMLKSLAICRRVRDEIEDFAGRMPESPKEKPGGFLLVEKSAVTIINRAANNYLNFHKFMLKSFHV
jgi:hypothetical protein